ncbi:MAG: hypothetical protein ACK42Z_10285, partial [Candidatus Kapaibacteriota bacterium]
IPLARTISWKASIIAFLSITCLACFFPIFYSNLFFLNKKWANAHSQSILNSSWYSATPKR